MFNWCQSVNIYNIENHYHYHNHNKTYTETKLNTNHKLKITPISQPKSSLTNNIAKHYQNHEYQNNNQQDQKIPKRGLTLSKIFPKTEPNNHKSTTKNKCEKQKILRKLDFEGNVVELFTSLQDLSKLKTSENENPSRNITQPKHISKVHTYESEVPQIHSNIQQIKIKEKPNLPESHKEINTTLLTRIYSTECRDSYSTNILQPTTSRNRDIEEELLEKSSEKNERMYGKGEEDEQYSDEHESDLYYEGDSCKDSYRSIVHSSLSQSIIKSEQSITENVKESMYFKILEMSRGEARQASIILTNILHRSPSSKCYASSHSPTQNSAKKPTLLALHTLNDPDKKTILSKNNTNSNKSLQIEESYVNELNPSSNFIEIESTKIETNNYKMCLSIEVNIRCLVSIKEIMHENMEDISKELFVYEYIKEHIKDEDISRNILKLYQIQISNSSYIFIKEPYTKTATQELKECNPQEQTSLLSTILEFIRFILQELSTYSLVPAKLILISDFVVCEGIVKIMNLNMFQLDSQGESLALEQIFEGLRNDWMHLVG